MYRGTRRNPTNVCPKNDASSAASINALSIAPGRLVGFAGGSGAATAAPA
jgi:hypothetical protein